MIHTAADEHWVGGITHVDNLQPSEIIRASPISEAGDVSKVAGNVKAFGSVVCGIAADSHRTHRVGDAENLQPADVVGRGRSVAQDIDIVS